MSTTMGKYSRRMRTLCPTSALGTESGSGISGSFRSPSGGAGRVGSSELSVVSVFTAISVPAVGGAMGGLEGSGTSERERTAGLALGGSLGVADLFISEGSLSTPSVFAVSIHLSSRVPELGWRISLVLRTFLKLNGGTHPTMTDEYFDTGLRSFG